MESMIMIGARSITTHSTVQTYDNIGIHIRQLASSQTQAK